MELKIHIISLTHGITEQLKAEYAFEWIGRMNNIQVCAMEIVNDESFIHITDKRLRIKALSLCVYQITYLLTFGHFLNIIVILLIAIYRGCTMDNIILGLLLMCNRTIYQLRDRISKGINLMYSSSMGSIQAAVKKLLNCGYISYEEIIDNGKYKKIYCITESGKQHFYEWINAPLEEQSPKIPELAKVYFMGFSDKKNRETSIQQHLMYLKEQYNVLATICDNVKNIDVLEEHKDILNYQFVSALYGKDIIKFNIDWFENLLEKMRNGEI